MGKTSIEWTDESWPIVNGCRRASPGCENCYAERLSSTRLVKTPKYGGLAVFKPGHGPQWTGETRLWEPELDAPLRLKTPSRIFVADMGDLFFGNVLVEDILAVFGVMALAPWHTYQVLTKRADRMRSIVSQLAAKGAEKALDVCLDAAARRFAFAMPKHAAELARAAYAKHGLDHREAAPWPMPWVWLGVSVENQKYADERIPELLATPAAVRFVSYEPALEPVDFTPWVRCSICKQAREHLLHERPPPFGVSNGVGELRNVPAHSFKAQSPIDWVIVGGESGPGARPFDLAWARSTIEQCKAAGVACFVKQLGKAPKSKLAADRNRPKLSGKGGDWDEWPEDLRVRQWPEVP